MRCLWSVCVCFSFHLPLPLPLPPTTPFKVESLRNRPTRMLFVGLEIDFALATVCVCVCVCVYVCVCVCLCVCACRTLFWQRAKVPVPSVAKKWLKAAHVLHQICLFVYLSSIGFFIRQFARDELKAGYVQLDNGLTHVQPDKYFNYFSWEMNENLITWSGIQCFF